MTAFRERRPRDLATEWVVSGVLGSPGIEPRAARQLSRIEPGKRAVANKAASIMALRGRADSSFSPSAQPDHPESDRRPQQEKRYPRDTLCRRFPQGYRIWLYVILSETKDLLSSRHARTMEMAQVRHQMVRATRRSNRSFASLRMTERLQQRHMR